MKTLKRALVMSLAAIMLVCLLPFTATANTPTIIVERSVYEPNETIIVIVPGLTQEMIDRGASLSMCRAGAGHTDNEMVRRNEIGRINRGDEEFRGTTFTTNNMPEFGDYEIRLYVRVPGNSAWRSQETFVTSASFTFVEVGGTKPAVAPAYTPGTEETLLAQAQVYSTSNGDGITPFNLRWEVDDEEKRIAVIDSQSMVTLEQWNSEWVLGFEMLLFHNGSYVGRAQTHLSMNTTTAKRSLITKSNLEAGDYVFIARTALVKSNPASGMYDIRESYGQWAKSPVYTVGAAPTNPTTPPNSGPLSLPVGRTVTTFYSGGARSFAIMNDGSLWGWGDNTNNALGGGMYSTHRTPEKIMDGIAAISRTHVVKTDGSLWAWGSNSNGQLGDGTTELRREPVKIMDGVAAVSSGIDHTLILKTDGSLWACGSNVWGQLGNGSTTNANTANSTPIRVMDGVSAISAGWMYSLVLKTDGTVWSWGYSGNEGRNGIPSSVTNGYQATPTKILDGAAAVYAGSAFGAAIKTDGSLWTWGANHNGQLGNGNGRPEASVHTPTKVMDGVSSAALSLSGTATTDFMMVLKTDGSVWACGNNSYGMYGNGTTTHDRAKTPVKVIDGGVVAIAASGTNTMALFHDGSLWAWGYNNSYQIGNGEGGSNQSQLTPAFVMNGVKMPSGATAPTTPTTPANPLDSASSWARDGITSALAKGFVPSDLQNNYTNVITRAEFCRMAVKWLEYRLGKSIDAIVAENGDPAKMNHTFSDTTDPNILAAYRLGITTGTTSPTATSPGLFTPNGEFSREQAATMIRNVCRAAGMNVNNTASAGFTDIGTASSWAVDGINYVRNAGIMQGTSTTPLVFSPKQTYTREQSILTFNNIQ